MNQVSAPFPKELLAEPTNLTTALNEAGRQAALRSARAGNPVATWENGKVVWLSPEEVFARVAKADEQQR